MSDAERLGVEVPGWVPPSRPDGLTVLEGRHVRLERMDPDLHAADLHRAFSVDDSLWDYMPYGPFGSAARYHRWAKDTAMGNDPVFLVLRDLETGHCGGVASFLRITPEAGTIEVGHICLAPELQRSLASTEAMFLMMGWAFEAGYRRYEWKCDALNLPSRRAAERFGFSYEGTFRQHMIYKGRNRDTAWFAMTDEDWKKLRPCYDRWLQPENFGQDGRQRQSLSALTRPHLVTRDPVPD